MSTVDIIERLKKIKALAEKGTEGEKVSAQKLLETLMSKHGIKDEDLSYTETKGYTFKCVGEMEIRLFGQICAHYEEMEGREIKYLTPLHIRKGHKTSFSRQIKNMYNYKKGDNCYVECTATDFVEIAAMFAIYKQNLEENLKTFYYAFLLKNGLLITKGANTTPSDEEVSRATKALSMASGIDKAHYYKQIGTEQQD